MEDNVELKKQRPVYQAPQTKEEAIALIKNLPQKNFAKLKGKGLTLIESWFNDDSLQAKKSLFTSLIADVCNQMNKEITDAIKLIEE